MYETLTSWAEDELNFRPTDEFSTGRTEVQIATESMCEFIDNLREKLNKLKEELPSQK